MTPQPNPRSRPRTPSDCTRRRAAEVRPPRPVAWLREPSEVARLAACASGGGVVGVMEWWRVEGRGAEWWSVAAQQRWRRRRRQSAAGSIAGCDLTSWPSTGTECRLTGVTMPSPTPQPTKRPAPVLPTRNSTGDRDITGSCVMCCEACAARIETSSEQQRQLSLDWCCGLPALSHPHFAGVSQRHMSSGAI